jgi:hypothetical protein
MLLELDISEVLELIESPCTLAMKVNEALSILRASPSGLVGCDGGLAKWPASSQGVCAQCFLKKHGCCDPSDGRFYCADCWGQYQSSPYAHANNEPTVADGQPDAHTVSLANNFLHSHSAANNLSCANAYFGATGCPDDAFHETRTQVSERIAVSCSDLGAAKPSPHVQHLWQLPPPPPPPPLMPSPSPPPPPMSSPLPAKVVAQYSPFKASTPPVSQSPRLRRHPVSRAEEPPSCTVTSSDGESGAATSHCVSKRLDMSACTRMPRLGVPRASPCAVIVDAVETVDDLDDIRGRLTEMNYSK